MSEPATTVSDARPRVAAAAVSVRDLRKHYGSVPAVDGVSLDVPTGAVFALVGPNGAGKTTTMGCIEGLKVPDAGAVRVLGLDPQTERERLYRRVGVQMQEDGMYGRIRVGEALTLFASFYDDPLSPLELLERFDLVDKQGAYFSSLSGGQKRRVSLAIALLGRPEVILLDEPTSGLDPHGRRRLWKTIRSTCGAGATILLTTHLLDEAEDHCDEVAMMDRGRVVAVGSPRDLMEQYGLQTRITCPEHAEVTVAQLRRIGGVTHVDARDGRVFVYAGRAAAADAVGRAFAERHVDRSQFEIRPATLEDLYLMITGREYVAGVGE